MSGGRKVFVRDATGLVRSISTLDSFLASWGFLALPLALITYTTGPYLFPGGDLVFATILTTILCIPIALMFTLFSWALPRSGGDYVLISRTIHPVLGYISSFSISFWFLFFTGFETNWVTTAAISPTLLIIGTVTSNQSLISLATTITQPQYVVAVGLVIVVIFTIILLRGVRATFVVNNLIILISIIGVGVAIWLLAASSSQAFVESFSRFASYNHIIATAHQQGYSPVGPWTASLGLMPYIYATTGFAFVTTYYAGEIKSVKKNLFYSQVLVAILSGILLVIIAAYSVQDFGYDFLGSISFLQGTGASQYPFSIPPFLNLFLSMLTDNPVILWLLGVGYVVTLLGAFLPSLMAVSRSAFAWSFDRVIPAKFAEVDERLHVPVYTIIVMSIVWAVSMIGYTYGPSYFLALTSGGLVGEDISLLVVSVAAIIFPFRRKALYESSPANMNIGPIPLLSIAGIISLASIATMQYFLLSNPLYGANSPSVLIPVVVIFLIGGVLYTASYYYQRAKGMDISLAFKEVPPE